MFGRDVLRERQRQERARWGRVAAFAHVVLPASLAAVATIAVGCGAPTVNPDGLEAGLSDLILRPDVHCVQLRDAFGLSYLPLPEDPSAAGLGAYEELWIVTSRDEFIHTWYIPADLDRGLVIISNGAPASVSCYLYTAKLLSDNGWSVVMYDYPGHGLSTGSPSLERLPDVLESVLDWSLARTRRPEATLLGISIGTLPVVSVAARRPETVNAIILDSPVPLGEELQRLDPFLAAYSQQAVRALPPELKPEDVIREVSQPGLFLLHEADILAPPSLAQVLIDRIQGPATVFTFAGLPHSNGIYFNTADYIAQVEVFLTGVWAGSP